MIAQIVIDFWASTECIETVELDDEAAFGRTNTLGISVYGIHDWTYGLHYCNNRRSEQRQGAARQKK